MVKNWGTLLKTVRSLLMRSGRSRDDSEDLAQEAWLHMALYELENPVHEPGAFLYRTAMNLAASADRARAVRGKQVDVDEMTLTDPSPSIEDTVLARERLARLDACLQRLDARTRSLYLDVRYRGISYQQAAQQRGLSVSAVEKQMTKATMLVTRWMEGW